MAKPKVMAGETAGNISIRDIRQEACLKINKMNSNMHL
jgi:hypothetical protein